VNRRDIFCNTEKRAEPGHPTPAVLAWRARRRPTLRHDDLVETSVDAVVSYVDRALDQMAEIVTELGDDLANRKPVLPGSNSPYAILRHCLGVMEFWGGKVVAGRQITRDRDAEFRAHGPAAGLTAAAMDAKRRFRADAATAEFAAPPRGGTDDDMSPDELEFSSQGHALLHVLEEVTQHLGQMELTRDVLRAAGTAPG
jgi:Protein of unknown function (DUF664)